MDIDGLDAHKVCVAVCFGHDAVFELDHPVVIAVGGLLPLQVQQADTGCDDHDNPQQWQQEEQNRHTADGFRPFAQSTSAREDRADQVRQQIAGEDDDSEECRNQEASHLHDGSHRVNPVPDARCEALCRPCHHRPARPLWPRSDSSSRRRSASARFRPGTVASDPADAVCSVTVASPKNRSSGLAVTSTYCMRA